MSTKIPGEGSPILPSEVHGRLSVSVIAQQVISEGGILHRVTAEHTLRFANVPLFGRIETYFVSRSVKKEYVGALKDVFHAEAQRQQYSVQASAYDTLIRPKLLTTDLERIPYFEAFIRAEYGVAYFTSTLAQEEPKPKDVETLHTSIDKAINTTQKEPEKVSKVLSSFGATQELFTALPETSQHELLDTFIDKVDKQDPKFETSLQQHDAFVTEAGQVPEFKNYVAQKSPEERGKLLQFALTEGGNAYLRKALAVHGNNPAKIKEVIDDSIQAQQRNGDLLAVAFATSRLSEKLQSDQNFTLFAELVKKSGEVDHTEFEEFIQNYRQRLVEAEEAKAEIPR